MIKIRDGYSLRNVLDVYIVMTTGREAYKPNCIMSTNETGAFLWEFLKDGCDTAVLTDKMTEAFEVDAETAERDINLFLAQLRSQELLIEC